VEDKVTFYRRLAFLVGLVTILFGAFVWWSGRTPTANALFWVLGASVLMLASFVQPRSKQARFLIVAAFFVYTAIHESLLIYGFLSEVESSQIFASLFFGAAGLVALIASARHARRRRIPRDHLYFYD